MKIMQINDTKLRIGGAENYIYNLSDLLKENGHEVDFIGLNNFGSFLSIFTRFYNPRAYFHVSRQIKQFKPDVIHCHNISRNISPSVLHAAKMNKIPVVMTVHDFHLICPKTWFIYENGEPCPYGLGWRCCVSNCLTFKRGKKYIIYHLLKILKVVLHRNIIKKNVAVFISPSECLAKWLQKSLQIETETISNYIDLSDINYKKIKNNKRILYVGRLSEEKGIKYLINAMPIILKKIPEAKLIVVGRGPEENNLKKISKELKITENVFFEGYVTDKQLKKHYQEAEIFAIPSYWAENFPLVILEAMAYGKPIIASDIYGLSERIRNNDIGLLYSPYDSEDLSNKMIILLSDFKEIQRMSQESLKKVKQFTKEKHYKEIIKIYNSLLIGSRTKILGGI